MNAHNPREFAERRQLVSALRSLRRGDFSVRLPEDDAGFDHEIATLFNEVVAMNQEITSEFERLSEVVGKEGKITHRARVRGATGGWETKLRAVNELIDDMVQPTAEVSRVIGAVAKGDLSQAMAVEIDGRPLRGEFLRIGKVVNTMVEQLGSFASEVTRVAREVGTEGKLGGQAQVKGVAGTWKDLTDNVNAMATNLTGQVRNIAEVTTAVASGDLSKKITVDVKGEILELKNTVNTMVDQLNSFASEVTRVAREVGTEGKLGGQARVEGVAGTWADLTDNVNLMAENLTGQVRNIAEVTTAVASGDLSKKITVDVKGEILELKNTINTMVDQLNAFAGEVTRVAREVGTEGKLGGQAQVPGVGGTWKDLTDNVNLMADNLTGQVRNIAEVTTAVALGDLSKKITVDVKGEILELKNTINVMVDQLNGFASEVTRVAREVGTEGKLGGQAQVPGVAGTWKDLTDSVNLMAANLTGQVRNIAEVTTAVARGDLSKKITVEVRGEILALKDTINVMVDQLNGFASEVTRVAREVGSEGKLGGQARVEGVAGTWADLTDSVNLMAGNLTGQVRNIAEVTTAVARGDLSKKITVDVKGEILELKDTINVMVDQLNSFASEVTRVAREVGSDGKLGGQAQVPGVGGTWKDLTDNVNAMAANLTGQVRNIAEVTTAVALGDLSKKITVDVKGEILELKNTINTMVDQLNSFASEVTRVAREVGTEGKLGGQAQVPGVAGTWKDLTDNVNSMAENLTGQVRNIADVTTAVARGDLSKKITVDVKGEILALKDTINVMVDQLNSFASEVTRVAREVGTEGRLGGQAQVPGVGGTWKDLTDNVNLMANNLTNQVRGIADVVTAVAQGNLKRKLTLDAKGEIAALAETINFMIETLSTFGDQVTNMAREVGIEGRLGGQARVPGAAGLWRDLTDNVNQLAANLTNQVRSIADVATAVTKGDLTRSIAVEASGEMASLKDNINEMIRNLKDQTLKNAEQDWLKTNLARFSRMLQGERDLTTVSNLIMSELAPLVNAQYGVFYVTQRDENDSYLELAASYGAESKNELKERFGLREGLVGQAAADKRPIVLKDVPADFIRIGSGLGHAKPANVAVLPALFEDDVKAVIELASFGDFNETHQSFLDQLMESVGIVLNTIAATMRTEGLLKQSQLLTQELQARQTELTTKQEELHATNEELQEKAQLLENEKKQVEAKNLEIDMARRAVEEKAEQLALTSKYKSEFLANMSHELRTPLNSLLILSKLLADNPQGNLNEKQTEFARTINSAGSDLLSLINDILDLSKIESGTVSIEVGDMPMSAMKQHMERTFRQLAQDKGLRFDVVFDPALPASIRTDEKRLQQVVLNLLSNAFKFTAQGGVTLSVAAVDGGWSAGHPVLHAAEGAIAIAVTDTGIGIPEDKQKLIFEAFQQADGTTSRKYGGTGLGLSISREIARMLGGELQVRSKPGEGSTFTLFVPLEAGIIAGNVEGTPARYENSGAAVPLALPPSDVVDDREALGHDPFVLIVEDDATFASILLDLAREAGLKGVVSTAGAGMLALARKLQPDAITLDLGLNDIDGFVLLDLLKHDPQTQHLPIHVISGAADIRAVSRLGAFSITEKPADRSELIEVFRSIHAHIHRAERRVLVIGGQANDRKAIGQIVADPLIEVESAATLARAQEKFGIDQFDLIVLAGGETAAAARDLAALATIGTPLLVASKGEESAAMQAALAKLADTRDVPIVHSLEALPGAVAPALRRGKRAGNDNENPAPGREAPELAGAKILIVDDDIRNIFSLTSVLESFGAEVMHAERGRDGIRILEETPGIAIALIDIMMPEMDGYETMQQIRQRPMLADVPLVAVTAKAMKGDRQKCLDAGASDYIAKPVDIDLLLALLRVWIDRSRSRTVLAAEPDRPIGGGVTLGTMRARMMELTPAPKPRLRALASDPDRARVLVVDDDERNLLAIRTVLEDVADIVEARSGEEALRHVLKHEFAVILLDVYMPGMDGYEVAQIVRGRDQSKRTPIVFLSAVNKETEHLLRGYSMGAVDYVFKPVEPVVLRSKVAVFVDLFRMRREIQRKAREQEELLEANLKTTGELIRAEQELRIAEQRQAAIINSLPIVLYLEPFDRTPRWPAFISGDLHAITGFTIEQIAQDPHIWEQRLHPEDRERVLACLDERKTTGRLSIEYRWRAADEGYRHFLDQAVLLPGEDGEPGEFAGTLLDVTERKALETQLLQAHKMDAIGKLVGGVAHDFNNLLAAVLGGIGLIERRLQLGDEQKKVLSMTRHAAEQGTELVRRLLAFARRQKLQPAPIGLKEMSNRLNELLAHTLGGLVETRWDGMDRCWHAFADETQLELALMNLIINARDAMSEGGTITIAAANCGAAEAAALSLPPGDYVTLAVSDTGDGIAPAMIEQVMEPFFTTKPVGKGTGLGLSMVYGFARQSGGSVQIESEVGHGTTVTIWLPRARGDGTLLAAAARDCPEGEAMRPLRILLVDDHEGVRAMTAAMLGELGHKVNAVRDGNSVVKRLKGGDRDWDLLITDYAMPTISGSELLRKAREHAPQLPALLITGYADPDVIGNRPDDVEVLVKPFTIDQLRAAIGRCAG